MATSFDPAALTMTGTANTIAEDVEYDWQTGELPVTSGSDGTLTYLNGRHRPTRLTWFDRAGRQGESLGDAAIYFDPMLSADGKSVVVERQDPNIEAGDLWIVDVMRGTSSRATHEPSFDNIGVWSPDGRQIVFSSDRGTIHAMYLTATGGAGTASKLLEDGWRTRRTNREISRCTYEHGRTARSNDKSRRRADESRSGAAMGKSSSTALRTAT